MLGKYEVPDTNLVVKLDTSPEYCTEIQVLRSPSTRIETVSGTQTLLDIDSSMHLSLEVCSRAVKSERYNIS